MSSDHFSPVAGQYATFRPGYPDELFDWLADAAPQRLAAWDCGAGSGQASTALAARFAQVTATDISAAQLDAAPRLPNVTYRVAPSEHSGLAGHSIDLLTVAQALHWFDLPAFYTEAQRVLKPGGVIAAWGYNRLRIGHPGIQAMIDRFYTETIGAYWPAERRHVESGYRDLSFPFTRIAAPSFCLGKQWSRAHLLGYLRSWSAVARFQAANGYDPVSVLDKELSALWPDAVCHRIEWPLFIHAGKTSDPSS